MPLTAQLQAVVGASDIATATAPDVGTLAPTTHTVAVQKVLDLAAGTRAGQVDVLYQDTNTLAASANTDLDLSGALAPAIGGTSVFVKVKGLVLLADAANTNDVLVGAAALLFKAVPVGILPVAAVRIRATGTTATNILGLY